MQDRGYHYPPTAAGGQPPPAPSKTIPVPRQFSLSSAAQVLETQG